MSGVKPDPRKERRSRKDSESILESIPRFVPTMQPTLVDDVPDGSDWLHEIKYDGYRTQLAIGSGQVRAFTRNGHDWTERYPHVVESARRIDCWSALIDGEICVQDERGVTDFAALQGAVGRDPGRLVYFAFDLIGLNGVDLRSAPLEERRAHLRWILEGSSSKIHISDEYDGDGKAFFELVDRMGLEGVVSKKKGSRYVSGSTRNWLKAKCWHVGDFEVIGVERDKTGVPYALLADDSGYRGAAFIGLPASLRNAFWRFVDDRAMDRPAFPAIRKKGATWLKPGMRASVRYLKGSDKLRHATIQKVEFLKPPS